MSEPRQLAPNSLTKRARKRAVFAPAVQGDLAAALADPEAFASIAPRVPRPVAYLFDAILTTDEGVTARDMALFELLVTNAVEADPTLVTLTESRTYPVKAALVFMSVGGWTAKPRDLAASLHRIFHRPLETLSAKGEFTYALPAWVCPHLRAGQRYGYLDLAAMARFRIRATSALYRRVLGHLALNRVRYVPGAEPVRIDLTPQELGRMVGYPGTVHVGKLRASYLTPALTEILQHVDVFEIDVEDAHKGLGRAVETMTLVVRLKPPRRLETLPVRAIDPLDFKFMHERPDEPRFRVDPSTLVRVGSALPSRIRKQRKAGGRAHPLLPSEMGDWHRLWLVALREALTGEALTTSSQIRDFRGTNLLDAVDRLGADDAFFAWCMEEADAPDMGPATVDRFILFREADADRKARWKGHLAKRGTESRTGLRLDRDAGIVAPATPRKAKVRKAAPVVEAAPALPAAVAPVVEAPRQEDDRPLAERLAELDARARDLHATPEAKAEANRLYQDLGIAFDFPHRHAGTTLTRIADRFAVDYPRLAEADEVVLGMYVVNLRQLAALTRDEVPSEDEFQHYIALLAQTPLIGIRNGKPGPVVDGMRHVRQIYWRDRKAADARRQEAASRNAGRYVRGQADGARSDREIAGMKPIDWDAIHAARRQGSALVGLQYADLNVDDREV